MSTSRPSSLVWRISPILLLFHLDGSLFQVNEIHTPKKYFQDNAPHYIPYHDINTLQKIDGAEMEEKQQIIPKMS